MTSVDYATNDEVAKIYIDSLSKLKKYGDIDSDTFAKAMEFAAHASNSYKPTASKKAPVTKRQVNQVQADKIASLKTMLNDSNRVLKEVTETLKQKESELASVKRYNLVLKDLIELFRDGHSDSESFSEACEKYDEVNRLAEG